MNWVDAGVIAVLVLALIAGWKAGVLPGAGVLMGAAIGLAFALKYDARFGRLFTEDEAAWLIGYVFFIGMGALLGLLAGIVARQLAKMLWLGWADHLGGAVASVLVAAFALSVGLLLLNESSHTPRWVANGVRDSTLAEKILHRSALVRSSMPEEL